MKQLFFLLLSTLFWGQEKDSMDIHLATFKGNKELYQELYEPSCFLSNKVSSNLDNSVPIFITNIIKCNNLGNDKDNYVVSGYWYNKFVYYKISDENQVFLTKNLFNATNELQKNTFKDVKELYGDLPQSKKDNILTNSLLMSSVYTERKREELKELVFSYKKYGIGVINANPYEDGYATGADFKIFNASSKTIKYITFHFYGKNAVKDKVLYRAGAYNTSRKGIGPVEPFSMASWSFDSVWLTDIVQSLTLTSMTIQYMDNTSKVVKMSDNLWFSNYETIRDQFKELTNREENDEGN